MKARGTWQGTEGPRSPELIPCSTTQLHAQEMGRFLTGKVDKPMRETRRSQETGRSSPISHKEAQAGRLCTCTFHGLSLVLHCKILSNTKGHQTCEESLWHDRQKPKEELGRGGAIQE